MKKITKITSVLTLIFSYFLMMSNVAYAGIDVPSNMDDIYVSDAVANSIGGQIIWVAQIILYAAAVIAVMFAGIKYMWAAPEAKAELKKKLIYIAVGAVILFAAGSLVGLIGGMALNNI